MEMSAKLRFWKNWFWLFWWREMDHRRKDILTFWGFVLFLFYRGLFRLRRGIGSNDIRIGFLNLTLFTGNVSLSLIIWCTYSSWTQYKSRFWWFFQTKAAFFFNNFLKIYFIIDFLLSILFLHLNNFFNKFNFGFQ